MEGHATNVAATVAELVLQEESYYGLAAGTVVGGSLGRCTGSNILAAFDDAIANEMDILSLSFGGDGGIKELRLRISERDSGDNDDDLISLEGKKDEMKVLGAKGVIMIDDERRAVASNYGSFPMTVISSEDGTKIHAYINSTR
ncbi:Subtilisin-like protease [Melia azedarach]|uniref:Subtilisin-like protease n=1 Tax=Melia azedarach TaxID=155640 RepID=A0ACC1WV46_MELAZ|nr:Subtilisin-like protease [Melia azedarach]